MAMKQKKEMGRMLQPDASPSKQTKKRKISPERIPCKLLPGTPTTPPKPKVPKWKSQDAGLWKQILAKTDIGPEAHDLQIVTTSSTTPQLVTNVQIELIDNLDETCRPTTPTETTRDILVIVPKMMSPTTRAAMVLSSAVTPSNLVMPFKPSPTQTEQTAHSDESYSDYRVEIGRVIDPLDLEIDKEPSPTQTELTATSVESYSDYRVKIHRVIDPLDLEIDKEPSPTQRADYDECDSDYKVEIDRDVPLIDKINQILSNFVTHNPGSDIMTNEEECEENEVESEEIEVEYDENEVECDENEVECEDMPVIITFASDFPAEIPDNINPDKIRQILHQENQDDNYLQTIADAEKLQFDWCQDLKTFQGTKEVFTGKAGPTFELDASTSPLEILEKIWDSEIISLIVEQTNIYAQQLLEKQNFKTKSRMKKWKPVTFQEIWLFFCVLILQSLDPRPMEKDYWQSSVAFLQMPAFTSVMSLKRFLLIKKCLHFVNNDDIIPKTDKVAKLRPVIDHLNTKFSELYSLGQDIALDESLLLWKGRLNFVQKISNKAARVGIKTYELCDSKSGYLWTFRVYTGKDVTTEADKVNECPDESDGKISTIVFDLVRPLLNKGHVLVMDNFYNSPLLSRLLKLQKTDTFGTLRISREFVPESIKNTTKRDLRVGEVAFSVTKDMSVVLWRDSSVVALISTFHAVEMSGKEKYGTYKYKPQVVLDYNNAMGGVDKKDQFLSAFPMERCRNHIWYKKLFRRLLNVSITNSWIIMKTKKNISHRKFREKLVEDIAKKYQISVNQVINKNPTGKPLLIGGHYIEKGTASRARCKWCAQRGRDSRTMRRCDVCKVALCADPCFKNYHTKNL